MLIPNYIVLDAARMGMDIETAKQFNPMFKCLYQGKTELELSGLAPFLFSDSSNFEFKQWFEKLSNVNLIFHIFLPFSELFIHLRRFLNEKKFINQGMYFRFYNSFLFCFVFKKITRFEPVIDELLIKHKFKVVNKIEEISFPLVSVNLSKFNEQEFLDSFNTLKIFTGFISKLKYILT